MKQELFNYLKEQLRVLLNVKQQKMKLAKNIKNLIHNVIFYQILMLFEFLKNFYIPL